MKHRVTGTYRSKSLSLNARLLASLACLLQLLKLSHVGLGAGVLSCLEDTQHRCLRVLEHVLWDAIKVAIDGSNDVAIETVAATPIVELELGYEKTLNDEFVDDSDLLNIILVAVAEELSVRVRVKGELESDALTELVS